jgi:hypothetical protein
LQARQAVMQFIQVSLPPREVGTMCSRVRVVEVEAAAAVGAHMAVAHEELGVGQRRRLRQARGWDGAAHRDDGVHLDARLQPGGALDAAAQHLEGLAQRPGHAVAGVEHRRLPRRDPGLRASGHIELQHVHDPQR